MKIFGQSCIEAAKKIDVLQSAGTGAPLTDEQKALLMDMADDYRPLVDLGTGKPVMKHHCIEAFRLLKVEVRVMVGENRRRLIALLHDVKARGFEHASVLQVEDPSDPRFILEAGQDVTPQEIADVING